MDMNVMQPFIELWHRYWVLRKWFTELKEKYVKLQSIYNESQDKYNELQNSFEESQDDLAATTELFLSYKKDAEEFQEELASTQEELAHANKTILKYEEELRKMRIRIDEVEEDRDNWKTEAIHRQNELNDIEMRNLMSEKPVQECCEYCKRTNCSDCVICPF